MNFLQSKLDLYSKIYTILLIFFFCSQGYICPKNYNPADFYISKIAISPIDKEASTEKVMVSIDKQIFNIYLI
jgi:hypothetical protein